MFSDEDTIAAISTPLGEGGIGIVRLSGPDSIRIAEEVFSSPKGKTLKDAGSYRMLHGYVRDPLSGNKVDEVLVSVMRSPHSYTREDVVEINCHGGMIALRKTLEAVLNRGARLAEPGEFTKRAFLNGRLDLSQAEAVLDLIRSKTEESGRMALQQLEGGFSGKITGLRDRLTDICVQIEARIDFPEDEIETAGKEAVSRSLKDVAGELQKLSKSYDEGRFFREGLSTAIVGRPNVGKSSLLNALLRRDRAIVTEIPGTTRDVIEDYLNIKGLPLRIMDTAGIRRGDDLAEREGVRRSLRSIEDADLVLAVFDMSEPPGPGDFEVIEKIRNRNAILVLNKCDLPLALGSDFPPPSPLSSSAPVLKISALRGDGIEELKDAVFSSCLKDWKEGREGVIVTNIRHKTSIERAFMSLEKALNAIAEEQPLEIVAIDLRDALDRLGEIVGAVTTEDILNKIFNEFCIGK